MWEYGHHFHTKDVDDGHLTQDGRVEFKFEQSSCSSHLDQNIKMGKFSYFRKIKEFIQVDFASLQFVILGASGGTHSIGIM